MDPFVSVVMPAFNVAEFVAESIGSVRRQTFADWELIVIDDGSTDATPDRVRSLLEEEPRIRYFRQDNAGVAAVRNRGILLARGEFLAFLDGDDLWDPRFLERTIAVHRERRLDCVCAYSHRLLPSGELSEYLIEKKERSGTMLVPWLRRALIVHINAMLLRRQSLIEKGLDFTSSCLNGEDTEFKCKVFTICDVHCVPEVLMTYRIRSGSATGRIWEADNFRHSDGAFQRAVSFVRDHYRGEDRREAVAECERQVDQRRYEASCRMLDTGRFQALKAFLADPGWVGSLRRIQRELPGRDRRRVTLILSRQAWLWRLRLRQRTAAVA